VPVDIARYDPQQWVGYKGHDKKTPDTLNTNHQQGIHLKVYEKLLFRNDLGGLDNLRQNRNKDSKSNHATAGTALGIWGFLTSTLTAQDRCGANTTDAKHGKCDSHPMESTKSPLENKNRQEGREDDFGTTEHLPN